MPEVQRTPLQALRPTASEPPKPKCARCDAEVPPGDLFSFSYYVDLAGTLTLTRGACCRACSKALDRFVTGR